ncbi:hypothetical protein [Longimicrobium sp.]|uniref:hypothetical protein n=1 Tax=Longimicrobium sp. TaxID=2029185 RepID=UPI002E2F3919|nr:hypothetical protein [Longimicrobium sp.]HEX6039691.1 hypothetical protein [Longimicrobium sp.]
MSLMPAVQRIVLLATIVQFLAPRPSQAQEAASIFTTLGKFASGFDAGLVFFAPTGFIHSDALKGNGDLQQLGFALNNPDLGITVGFDILTGFEAEDESLDIRGSIHALPTVSKHYDVVLPSFGSITPSTSLGLGIGLSQLHDFRATVAQSPESAQVLKVTGTGYHVGTSLAVGLSFGSAGFFIENSVRYTRFPSLDWTGDKLIPPPAGGPASMDLWTSTLRIGFGIGAPDEPAEQAVVPAPPPVTLAEHPAPR